MFDTVNAVNVFIAIQQSNYSVENVHRVLDDIITVDRPTVKNKNFIDTLLKNCKEANIDLADFKDDKAFLYKTKGEILGVVMDTENLTWSLKEKKINKILNILYMMKDKTYTNLHELQVTMGVITIFMIMSPPLRAFRSYLINDLQLAHQYENIKLSNGSRIELDFWINVLLDIEQGFPIHSLIPNPPIGTHIIATDAAGCSQDFLINTIGAGAAMEISDTIHLFQAPFPTHLVTTLEDCNGKRYGNKTCVLELCAILLPLYHCIKNYTGCNLIIHTDNLGCVWGWRKGRLKNCIYASCLIEALMTITVTFGVNLHIQHQKRCTTHLTIYADALTRDDTRAEATINKFPNDISYGFPPSLIKWLNNPPLHDSMLGLDITSDIENIIQ